MKRLQLFIFIATCILLIASVFPSFGELNRTKVELGFELRLDYFIHFCAYFGFYFLLIINRIISKTTISLITFWKVFFLTLSLAIGIEIIQLFLSYRTFNPFDLLANLSGIVFGALIYWIYCFFELRKIRSK